MLNGALKLFRGGIVGKLLGLLREALMAYLFGASDVVAAARVAQTAVLGPMNLLTSDALSGAFLPQEAVLLKENPSAARALYRSVQALFTVSAVLFVPAMLLMGHQWATLIAPGLDSSVSSIAFAMLMAMAVGAPWYVHFNMLAYLEMAHNSYKLSSIRSTGQSLGLILGVVGAYFLEQPTLIAWGFTAAYVVMCLGGYRHINKLGYFTGAPRGSWAELREVTKAFLLRLRILMLIPVLALAVDITEKMVSSTLGTAALASVDYARLVTETFVLLLAMPIGLASLGSFAVMSEEETTFTLRRVLQPLLIISLVAAGLVVSFSKAIVEVLYSRGAFDSDSVQITSAVLAGLGVGLWAQLCNFFTLKVLNARHRNLIAVVAVACGAVVTIVSRPFLAEGFGPFGIGLAVSLGFVASLTICLTALKAISIAVQCILISTPPLLLTVCAGLYTQGWEPWPSLGIGGLAIAVWSLYLLVLPRTRQTMREVMRTVFRKD